MGANISHHKRLQEKVTSKKSDVSVKQKSMAFEQNSISSNESVDDQNFKPTIKIAENKSPTQRNLIEEIGRPEKEEDQDSLEENKDIKKTNSNPTSLVITICMLKMENSEKMIVEQSAPSSSAVHLLSNTNEHNVPVPVAAAPKCRCYEIEGGSTNNSALNNLNKSRGSHLNIICDNKNNNGNSLMNNEENVNILNNNTESNHILNKFNLNNKFDNLTINDVNDNNSDEMYNQINDCSVLQLSGGSIISMDMDGLQGQFKFPGFNDEKILNTSISGPSNDSHISSSSCCRKKTSSSSSKNSIRKGCKCGNNPNSSKENAAHSPPSSSKSKKGNWGGLKFNCAKLKNNNVKTNSSFSSSSSDFPMETAKGKSEPESCVCTSYRKVEDCHSTPLPVSHPELTLLELDAQGNVIQRIETSRNTQSGSIVFFLNHGEPIMNISRSFNDEFPIDDIDERTRRLDNQLITTHPQPLFICTHSPCPSSPEPISLLHRRLLDNQNELNQNDIRIHSQVDFVHFLVPDLQKILACSYYWAKIDRYEAEKLLEGKPEGTFLLRDSAQEEFLFSVSFRKYNRSLHARIEQFNHKFSFDSRDPGVYTASTVTGLLEHYKDPAFVMFFEPMLTQPLNRNFSFSLQQLCRATIATHTTYDGVDKLCLPNSLKNYLKEYHYRHRVRSRENFYSNI